MGLIGMLAGLVAADAVIRLSVNKGPRSERGPGSNDLGSKRAAAARAASAGRAAAQAVLERLAWNVDVPGGSADTARPRWGTSSIAASVRR